jgi:hypothetical protein
MRLSARSRFVPFVITLSLAACGDLAPPRRHDTGANAGAAGWSYEPDAASGGGKSERKPSGFSSSFGGDGDGRTGSSSGGNHQGAGGKSSGGSRGVSVGGASGAGNGARSGSTGRASGGRAGKGGSAAGSGGNAAGGPEGGSGQGGRPQPQVFPHTFLFSEYVEGSASYKAIELRALETSSLDGCRLVTYFNGATEGTGLALTGPAPLAKDRTYVICSTSLAALLGDVCDRATNLSFNGNDALALECDGAIVDGIGQIGDDPGPMWGDKSAGTAGQTLRRRCSALLPDVALTAPFEPASEWQSFPEDTFDGLGDPSCAADDDVGNGGASNGGAPNDAAAGDQAT